MKGKRALVVLLPILLLPLAGGVLAQSGGDYDVEWNVIGSAGDQFVSGGDYQLGFTIPVEVDKPADERGTYLYPELYGQPEELGPDYQRNQGEE